MKKPLFILLFSVLLNTGLKAQFSIEYSAGYASYDMSDFKDIMENGLESMQSSYPEIPFRILDNFPGKITHNLNIGYLVKKHNFGLKFSYLTTGSKLAYADYSGEYMEKLTANGYSIKAFYRYYIPLAIDGTQSKFSLYGEISPGIIFSDMKYKGYIKVGDQVQVFPNQLDGNTEGFTVSPLIGLRYNILPQIGITFNTGYEFIVGSYINHKVFNDLTIDKKMDWSGFRANIGVSFTLKNGR